MKIPEKIMQKIKNILPPTAYFFVYYMYKLIIERRYRMKKSVELKGSKVIIANIIRFYSMKKIRRIDENTIRIYTLKNSLISTIKGFDCQIERMSLRTLRQVLNQI